MSAVSGCRMLALRALAIWMLAHTPLAAAPPLWDVKKFAGDEYVSIDSIKPFYQFTKLTRSGATLILENAKVIMTLKVGSNECIMNKVKFVFNKPVEEINSKAYVSRTDLAKLIDPVLRPHFIKNAGNFKTVILDAGHGGKDPGTVNPYGTEANYNLKLANLVKSRLLARRYKVVMTRDSDRFISLQERVNLANAIKEDAIFISIHFNSGDRGAHGIETFSLSPPGVAHYGRDTVDADKLQHAGNAYDSANIALATAAHGMALRTLGVNTFDRGIKRARYTVISGVVHPAILLEGGFMSHPYEARLINDEKYQAALAFAIAGAVDKFRSAVSPPSLTAAGN